MKSETCIPVVTHRLLMLLLLLLLMVATNWTIAAETKAKCPLSPSSLELSLPEHANISYINEDANVFFTVLLPDINCHSETNTTVAERRDSLIYLNAVKYALNLLNNASAQSDSNGPWTSTITHFFPLLNDLPLWPTHVKYGAKIINISTRKGLPKLSSLVSITLVNGRRLNFDLAQNCTHSPSSKQTIDDIAVLDGVHFFNEHSNNQILQQIPIISLSSTNSILTEAFKANLIVNLLDVLDWRHFGIITTKHEDSLYIVKILGQIAHAGHVCISDIFEWSTQDFSDPNQETANYNEHFRERLSSFMDSISYPKKKMPILVISNDEKHVSKLVDILHSRYANQLDKHQFFFSLVPSPELMSRLQVLSKVSTVFTLNSQLPDLPGFELKDLNSRECKNLDSPHKFQSSVLWQKWLSFLPIRSLMMVSMGLNSAWIDLCQRTAKSLEVPWCTELSFLERRSFFKYLDQLEDKIESKLMSLGTIDTAGKLTDLLLYNGDEFSVLKTNHSVAASNCQENDCASCIKFRQSRNDVNHFNNVRNLYPKRMMGHHNHNDLHILLNERESSTLADETEEMNDVPMLHVETYEVNLGLILPLHQSGASVLECSTELNLPAYYIFEAAQWIINKINQNNYLIPGIEIKLELIDTCSSPFYATQELVHLTSSESKVQPIAFVSSVPRDHYKQIVDFVSSINYTLIATQDISFMNLKFGPKFGVLQTAATNHAMVKVLVEQLKYFGWRYVSVVVDYDDLISTTMFHHLSELAASEKICFASVEHTAKATMNQTIANLLANYKNGANVVVLLTNFGTTATLMSYYQSSLSMVKFDKNENLHFILARDQNLEMVHGFEEEYMGSIFIRESIGSIGNFDNYFLDRLANPKKEQLLYKFIQQCGSNSAQCLRTINSFDKTVTSNTVQAILATVGGFARMRNETCVSQKGICTDMLDTDFHQKLLKYILNTRSMRIDSEVDRRFKSENFDVFEFTTDGSSARDIEILNFKHDFTNGLFRFDTVALYEHKTDSIVKNPNVRYVFYKYNGVVNGHKEYNETEFISSDCINLKQCGQCEPQTPEFIYMPSWNNLIITGIFDVHSHLAQNPLICDKNHTIYESVQNVEAFLWTIDMINNDPAMLPGVHLGALVFDSCSSYQKIYRDISNFLSDSLLLGDFKFQTPNAESVVGFVVDGKNMKIIDSILDLTNPLKMSVIASEAREIKYNNVKHYPQYLGLSLPNSFYIDAILNLLRRNSWSFVSVLYENNNFMTHRFLDAFSYFQNNAHNYGVKVAVKELFDENNINANIQSLKSAQKIGSKVIVLFLSEENLSKLLQFNTLLKDTKLLSQEILFIAIDSQKTFKKFSNQRLNVISITEDKDVVPEFKNHFFDLTLQNNIKNPWFSKLWEKAYDCKGFSCYRNTGDLKSRNITISPKTTNVINSVFSLVHGLEEIRQQLCPGAYSGLCANFHNRMRQISRLEHEVIKQGKFEGLDNRPITFNPESNYASGYLQVNNFQFDSSAKSFKWVPVGRFDAAQGLTIAVSKSRFYQDNGTILRFNEVISTCQDVSQCEKTIKDSNNELPLMVMPTEDSQATLALILPLHQSVRSPSGNITCGSINSEIFENLMAFYYALDLVNQNSSIRLNTLIVDSCAHNKQSLQRLASIQNYKSLSKVVSIISLSEGNQPLSNELWNMLSDYNPFVYNFYRKRFDGQNFFFNENNDYSRSDNQMFMLRSIVDFCLKNHWHTVNLVYTNEFNKNYFFFEANKNNICVEKTFKIAPKSFSKNKFYEEWRSFANSTDSQIMVLLVDSATVDYLFKSSSKQLLDNFIWIGDDNLKISSNYVSKSVKNAIVLKRRSRDNVFDHKALTSAMDNLSRYFEPNNKRLRSEMLVRWLKEYWKKKFNCVSNGQQRDSKCFASNYVRKSLINVKETKRLIDFVKVLGGVVSKFVQGKCNNTSGDEIDDLCLYNYHLRNELKNSIVDQLNSNNNNHLADYQTNSNDDAYDVQVLFNYGKTLKLFNSFNWINTSTIVLDANISTVCRTSCSYCQSQLSQSRSKSISMLFADSIQSPLISNANMHRTWGIVASIISTLGLIMVLICVLYFILVFPVALGTTIIGYQILIGLFFCYLINFVYLLPSTHFFCLIRQFGLPFVYCIILSGFFVKVYNYWSQLMTKRTTKQLIYSSPFAQLSISFTFIILQLVIALLSMYHSSPISNLPNTNGCTNDISSRGDLFHSKAILSSLLLVALFLAITFFAIRTLDNIESRWILVCSTLTAFTWLTWYTYTWFYPHNSIISIVVANLADASIIIALLYMRKLYLFSKISRKILKERRLNMDGGIPCEPFADTYQQYGAFKTCTDNISWNNIQYRFNFRNATRSPFEKDQEDNVSSCGSVKSNTSSQVQCQELYPMDVYDSQMPQANSRVGQSTRSIYDMIDEENMK